MPSTTVGSNTRGTRSKRLPERIVRSILSQQDASERLVGWFQLAVVMVFGILYSVAPKTVSAEKTFEIVPWFLAGYLLLTVIRLFLAYRSRIPGPLLYVSVIIDMSLLLVCGLLSVVCCKKRMYHNRCSQPCPAMLTCLT